MNEQRKILDTLLKSESEIQNETKLLIQILIERYNDRVGNGWYDDL